jgi:CheY-like chemotaxis protein
MDINMPVMDGCTATKHILSFQKQYQSRIEEDNQERKAMNQPLVPLIPLKISAITSYTNKANIDECFAVGMDEVIHKPVDFSTLKDILQRFYYTPEELKNITN